MKASQWRKMGTRVEKKEGSQSTEPAYHITRRQFRAAELRALYYTTLAFQRGQRSTVRSTVKDRANKRGKVGKGGPSKSYVDQMGGISKSRWKNTTTPLTASMISLNTKQTPAKSTLIDKSKLRYVRNVHSKGVLCVDGTKRRYTASKKASTPFELGASVGRAGALRATARHNNINHRPLSRSREFV
ncbi:hypothetical protein EVAR_101956_1 [Eumeta japonica]|uniref:Uncharacterized protein n=1 Tax=Eumeta variegata TaxID=151549 RepID=A0A4C1TSQ1_EUMVA|nr:hypothetical protein EVAR_101956_1 [Eumeta japonica]